MKIVWRLIHAIGMWNRSDRGTSGKRSIVASPRTTLLIICDHGNGKSSRDRSRMLAVQASHLRKRSHCHHHHQKQPRSRKNLACKTCATANGSSNQHAQLQEMDSTKVLIGCHGLCRRRRNESRDVATEQNLLSIESMQESGA